MPAPAEVRPRETLFMLLCRDAPGSAPLRETHMQGHLAFIDRSLARIAVAGPFPDGRGGIQGSLFLIRAASEDDALAFLEGDPYRRSGVWGAVEVQKFRAVAGTWMGGTTW